MLRLFRILVLLTVALVSAVNTERPAAKERPDSATGLDNSGPPVITDSIYNLHHPCILVSDEELAALRSKISGAGYDKNAWDYIRFLAENVYAYQSTAGLVSQEFGMNTIPNLGLAAIVPDPADTVSMRRGRNATLHIAVQYDADNNEADTGLRLKALTLGYDMFFGDSTDSLRTFVRDEIVSYLEHMTQSFTYELFSFRPYLANHSAMFAGPLGLAAVCLQGETRESLLTDVLALADGTIDSLLTYQFDPGGSYKEGVLYGSWTARQFIYYFHARKRFDGFNYADVEKIRNMENWFVYEMLPEGWGKTNNLNDSPYTSTPLARHSTYFDWAQYEWNSGLSAWLWEHTAGPYGIDMQMTADKVATVLWNQGLAPVQPGSVLPNRQLWIDRGLYHYRSGWQSGANSNDVLFSFYSGRFHGGHAQEDQNQFVMYAYGGKFAIDHGAGSTAAQSEAHNMVFIDGAGQHNAGASIGTDGDIADYLLANFADYIRGDATAAYTTYSEFNAADWPFPGWDWSWGYQGANPVDHASRGVITVHGAGSPPYFVVLDDIDKDGGSHNYQWRLHTLYTNPVVFSANPIRITSGPAFMDLHVLYPDFTSLSVSTQFFNNGVADPNSTLLTLDHVAVNPRFSTLLIPADSMVTAPAVARRVFPWGFSCQLDWPGGPRDVIVGNHTGAPKTWGPDSIRTDATALLLRETGAAVSGYLAVGVTELRIGNTEYLRVFGAPVTCALDGDTVRFNRADVSFLIYDTGISSVVYGDQEIPFVRRAGFLLPENPVTSDHPFTPQQQIAVAVFPNPFNPSVSIRINAPVGVALRVAVFDTAGRLVRSLGISKAVAAPMELRWDGTNQNGQQVSSGIYFLKVIADNNVRTKKIVLLK
jgi:hypothetical protein